MKQEDINKAFEGRWKYKCDDFEDNEVRQLSGEYIKELCRDFFETGIMLFQASTIDRYEVAKSLPKEFASAFDYWWEIYDKKRGRDKCMKKFYKLSAQDVKACLDATPAYVASTPDKKYRKDPLTYLNGKCWNDEIIPINGTDKPTKQDPRDKLADVLVG